MISHNRLAQYWEEMGHISYYQRIDLDALMRYEPAPQRKKKYIPLPFGGYGVATDDEDEED